MALNLINEVLENVAPALVENFKNLDGPNNPGNAHIGIRILGSEYYFASELYHYFRIHANNELITVEFSPIAGNRRSIDLVLWNNNIINVFDTLNALAFIELKVTYNTNTENNILDGSLMELAKAINKVFHNFDNINQRIPYFISIVFAETQFEENIIQQLQNHDQIIQNVFEMINQDRVTHNLPALELNPLLNPIFTSRLFTSIIWGHGDNLNVQLIQVH